MLERGARQEVRRDQKATLLPAMGHSAVTMDTLMRYSLGQSENQRSTDLSG